MIATAVAFGHIQFMTESDILEIESKLGIQVPQDYRHLVLRTGVEMAGMFSDVHQILAVNERNRQMSWLGRPLDRVFYIFAADENGREILMDLDTPGPAILLADYEHKCGKVLAWTFLEWVSRPDPAISQKDPPRCGRAIMRVFKGWFAVVTLAVCLVSVFLVWQDRSWGALYIAIIACPVANLVLMVLGSAAAFMVRRRHPETKLGVMLSTVLSLPPLGALVTVVATFMVPLHGC